MGGNDAGTRTGEKGWGGVDHSYTVILNGIFYLKMTAKTLIIISVFSYSSFGWYFCSFGWSHFLMDWWLSFMVGLKFILACLTNTSLIAVTVSVLVQVIVQLQHGLLIVLSLNLLINSKERVRTSFSKLLFDWSRWRLNVAKNMTATTISTVEYKQKEQEDDGPLFLAQPQWFHSNSNRAF